VSGLMAQSGWTLLLFGGAPAFMFVMGDATDGVLALLAASLIIEPFALCLLLLAFLPTDAKAIRCLCVALFVVFATVGIFFQLFLGNYLAAAPIFAANLGLGRTLLCCGPGFLQPRQALRWLWLVSRVLCFAVGAVIVFFAGALIGVDANLRGEKGQEIAIVMLFASGVSWITCALVATPVNRGRIHRYLGRLGGRGSEREEAAAVSALVAGADPETALAKAEALFRCLPCKQLHAPDLADNRGAPPEGPTLQERTVPATLGSVHAFFSHSWSDEKESPGAKFAAVMQWARRHQELTGEEPMLWLDKACIPQDNIEQSLACLPVFLSGCQTLLIVAGPTYCTRLWCVMEIFTFMHMGGAIERIEISMIARPDQDQAAAREELLAGFAGFEAGNAQCFKQADRQRLLAVIEAGFGDFNEFNRGVRTAFVQRVHAQRRRDLRNALRRSMKSKPSLKAVVVGAAQASSRASAEATEVESVV